MDVTVLGSGGSRPIPMPTCDCRLCRRARVVGPPESRIGNSLYLHDLATVVDAPAGLWRALNRERVAAVDRCLLTHWHPDHVAGVRALTARDATGFADDVPFTERYRADPPTLVTTERVYERACDLTSLRYHVEEQGAIDVRLLDDDALAVGDWTVSAVPYALAGDGDRDATAFVLDGPATVVVATDDARHLDVGRLPSAPDLAVFECGLFETGPDGESLLTETGREALADELRHEEVLSRVDALAPDRTLLTEIGHQYRRSHDDLVALESGPRYDGVTFAHDGLTLTV